MEKFDIDEMLAVLSARARANDDMLNISDIAELSAFEDAQEKDIAGLLELLGSEGTGFYCDIAPLDKKRIKKICETVADSCEDEKNACAGENTVKMYLEDISGLPLPDEGREKELRGLAAEGDPDAVSSLIESCMYLPVEAALRYLGRGMLYLDLVQEGNLAVMSAASEMPDPAVSFSAFCAFRIERLMRQLTDMPAQQDLKLPRGIAEELAEVMEQEKLLDKNMPEQEKAKAIAAALGIKEEKARQLLEKEKELSLNIKPEPEHDEEELPRQAEDVDSSESMMSKQVSEMLASLPEDEARVISMRFGLGGKKQMSVSEAAQAMGITEQQAAELEQQAMKHLGQ